MALQEVIEVVYIIRCLLLEILKLEKQNQILPIKSITDIKSLHDAVYSKTLIEKRLKIELCAIREPLEKEEIHSVIWVNSSDQFADCLMKREHPVKNYTMFLVEVAIIKSIKKTTTTNKKTGTIK